MIGTGQDVTELRAAEQELRDSEARFRLLADNATDFISRHDRDGTYLYASPACGELLGYGEEELVGRSPYDLLHADDRERFREWHAAVLQRAAALTVTVRLRRKDGLYVWFEIAARTVREPRTGAAREIQCATRDVSDRVAAAARLREAEERFRRTFEDSSIGMALIGAAPEETGRFLSANEALCRLVGRRAQDLLRSSLTSVVHPEDVPFVRRGMQALVAGETASLATEARCVHVEGPEIWVDLIASVVREESGDPLHLVVQLRDISERKRLDGQLQLLADRDALTGLFSRRRFTSELERELAFGRRYGTGGAVLVLDLDRLEAVNGTFDRSAGDELIAQVGRVLRKPAA